MYKVKQVYWVWTLSKIVQNPTVWQHLGEFFGAVEKVNSAL